MTAPADLAALFDERGWTVPAPTPHPITGVGEARWIAPEHLVSAAEAIDAAGYFYESMTCMDRLGALGGFELVTTFARWDSPARIALRVLAPKGTSVPSLTGVFAMAGWNEREAWEFFGVEFAGHPDLTWLLLPEGTEFRPLLKSFTAPPPSVWDDSLSKPAASADDDATARG